MEDILLAWLRASRGRRLILRVAGRLSGTHGWQSEHIPIDFEVIDSTVIIHFDGEERLTISDAADVGLDSNGGLFVRDASEVRFTWRSDKNPAQECEEICRKADRIVTFSRRDDLYTTSTTLGFFDHNLVVLRYEHLSP